MHKKILFLFAPKFRDFAVDIIRDLIATNPDLQVAGLCMEGERVVSFIKSNLPEKYIYKLWDLDALERSWVRDEVLSPEILAEIDRYLGVGASGQVIVADRRIGRGYVRGGLYWPDSLGDLAEAEPISVPLKYLQGLYKFCDQVFEDFKPDSVFCYAVASAPAVMLGLMCQAKKVKFLRFTSTRVGNLYILDEGFKSKSQPILQEIKSERLTPESIAMAEQYLNEYRKAPTQPNNVHFTRNNLRGGFSRVLIETFKMSLVFAQHTIIPNRAFKRVNFRQLKRKFFEINVELKRKGVSFSVFNNNLPNYKYFYFPLHVDPEASTMVLAHMHTDQISVIEAISKSLPGDSILVVKEHLPMVGRRPTGFYQTLRKIPRVVLITPHFDSLELVKNSEAVITITGTASFEAILLKKKTIIIGDHPILGIEEGFIYEPSLANLPKAIAQLKHFQYASEDATVRYLAAIFQCAFQMDTLILWGSYRDYPQEKKVDTVKAISSRLLKAIG